MADLRVELLAVEDCPHLEQARRDLESVLRRGIIETPIQLIFVASQEDAEFLGFQGSPTIRIQGEDVVPQPELPVALACRIYRDEDGRAFGSPPIEAIAAAVDAHRRGKLETFQREEAAKVAEFARRAEAADASSKEG
ncbi:MAG: thioredoxin family protein [Candidatus Limnocylindrales bacterium]